jgi:biotin/methionine sulfoxide reductase
MAMHKLVEPVGLARNDYEIFADLADRFGTRASFTEGRTEMEWVRHLWHAMADRLAPRGLKIPSFEEFWDKGFYEVPAPTTTYVMFERFRNDPAGAPLPTPSGKVELFSEWVAGLHDPEQPAHPVWADPEEWLGAEAAFRFPLHLLTPHPATRLHGQLDASSISKSGKSNDRELVLINPRDAQAREIADGDAVRLRNERGWCLATARVTDAIMPGVVSLPTGASYDPDGTGDRNSNPNVLTRDFATSNLGQGCAALSCLVEAERWRGELPPLRIHEPPHVVRRQPTA